MWVKRIVTATAVEEVRLQAQCPSCRECVAWSVISVESASASAPLGLSGQLGQQAARAATAGVAPRAADLVSVRRCPSCKRRYTRGVRGALRRTFRTQGVYVIIFLIASLFAAWRLGSLLFALGAAGVGLVALAMIVVWKLEELHEDSDTYVKRVPI
jgi:hypothetical protein